MKKQAKFGVGIGIIVVALGFLAWLGYGESKTYYHTIAELQNLNSSARAQRIRVGGTVAVGSIHRTAGRVDFVLEELNEKGLPLSKALPVSYGGSDPLPDTFVDKSQALVEGHMGSDGRFLAEKVSAKCASKYEAAPGGDTKGAAASSTQPSSSM